MALGVGRKELVMVGVLLVGVLLAVLNQTLLSPALPAIMGDLQVDATTVQWLTSGYSLVEAVVIPLSAYLIGRFSTRQLFISAFALFTAGSLAAAVAPNFWVLLLGRVLQAACTGMSMPMVFTVILLVFPREKRGTAINVPVWNAQKCIGCNKCSYVCPHASIRPVLTTDEELAAAPEGFPSKEVRAVKDYHFTVAVSTMDCLGCGNCAQVCPVKALDMTPLDDDLKAKQAYFDYGVDTEKVAPKKNPMKKETVIGSQFEQPLIEFSGACAGCGETPYAKLITQLFGDRMMIANATGCTSIWGGSAPAMPYTTNAKGHGPAWDNSLFEDNAEFGLGMFLGTQSVRNGLADDAKKAIEEGLGSEDLQAALKDWVENLDNGNGTRDRADHLEALLAAEKGDNALLNKLYENRDYFVKRSQWIFGGDGWAYDIGYGGVDHVLASGADVNVFVFDTEVYSNTGGQASKASNIGQVAQFAAAGKETKKKSLAEIAMSYGYIYVAQIAMGANPAQTIKAITEAEAYNGPSLIIGYSPCEMHSIKGGMINCQKEMKKAVECGYWNLFRFNPEAAAGKKFSLDSKEPAGGYQEFLMNEARYASLTRSFPERAEELFKENEQAAMDRYQHLLKLKTVYNEA